MDRLQPWANDLTHRSAKKGCHAALRLEELARQGDDLSQVLDRLLKLMGDRKVPTNDLPARPGPPAAAI